MVALAMVTLTQRRKRASQMMARTVLGSWPFFLRVAHCKSVVQTGGLFLPQLFAIDFLFFFFFFCFRDGAHSVTAVGGTTQVPEVAAEFSGGGFSDLVRSAFFCSWCVTTALTRRCFKFKRPKWQEVAVERFLKSLPNGAYAGLFNPHGRVRGH